jgi:NTE family protein
MDGGMNAPVTPPRNARKPVNLALQGGGAHGAFTWGVLDKLLEDGRLSIAAISSTSAGAMNAIALIDGWHRGGIEGARAGLEKLWTDMAKFSWLSPIQRGPVEHLLGTWSLDRSPGYLWLDFMSRLYSPYDLNPIDYNPLRDYLAQSIDFDRILASDHIHLFVAATNVHTGRVRVFDNFRTRDISLDAVMASACVPTIYKAVEIDGEPYWDGGYMGNPVLWPFFYSSRTDDLLIVEVNPIERTDTPKTAREIEDRLNEITFNASLQNELRAIGFVSRLVKDGRLDPQHYRDIRLHWISDPKTMTNLGASSKLNTEWAFLTFLRDAGRARAAAWLEENFDAVGERPSVDVRVLIGYKP